MKYSVDLVKKAYKKLKCNIFFDKTQTFTRKLLADFEQGDFEQELEKLQSDFFDDERWTAIEQEILNSITYRAMPKKLKENKKQEEGKAILISNVVPKETQVEKIQYFIGMDIRGHILGVLWLLLVGWRLDKKEYQNSYGNRMHRHICDELEKDREISFSPYLFEAYFQQYETWRNEGLNLAESKINGSQDILVLTMDFKSFFYSVDMNESARNELERLIEEDIEEEKIEIPFEEAQLNDSIYRKINDFIFKVIAKYSGLFGEKFGGRNILPIGFLPSNVLANWSLYKFDKAIVDGWNPLYYGRYVDDVIIVDKVEKNSDLYQKARKGEVDTDKILEYYFTQCTKWNGISKGEQCDSAFALFEKEIVSEKGDSGEEIHKKMYYIRPRYNIVEDSRSKIGLQNEKVKIFYFMNGESEALLTCFRNQISRNKSEFRFLPEDEAIFSRDDYTDIYNLDNEESINKLRGVNGVSVDKFELSKFLGKFVRICGLVNDKRESRFVRDMVKIFDTRTLLENYTAWEKILTILIGNGEWKMLDQMVGQILRAIETIRTDETDSKIQDMTSKIQDSLNAYFLEIWIHSMTLSWGTKVREHIEKTIRKHNKLPLEYEQIFEMRKAYLNARMYDKYAVPVMLDVLDEERIAEISDEREFSLCSLDCILRELPEHANRKNVEEWYHYYPFMVTMYDIYMMDMMLKLTEEEKDNVCQESTSGDEQSKLPVESLEIIEEIYIQINYNIRKENIREEERNVCTCRSNKLNASVIMVGKRKKKALRVAIANTKLNHKDFENLVKEKPNRSYERYMAVAGIINQAIKEKADLLVLPESFLPIEWLATVTRTCAKNQMAVVTGIEYVIYKKKIYNNTAVILPYKEHDISCAALSMHLKNHYAPSEKEEIRGYRLEEVKGNGYELYCWNDCWFPVYCCFELASIHDRAKFFSYADLLVAVEWNKDINYYSSIMESLGRDMHCYCIQANSSDYGDSRLMFPGRTENKDIIKTKGGMNHTILVGNIDIEGLREFQFKEYNLQQKDKRFKPTPPEFDKEITRLKMQGKLMEHFRSET